MKTNITLLLPLYIYQKKIAVDLAKKLNMILADIKELLAFELDVEKALSIGGKEYLEKEETKLIERISSYSNTLIILDTNTFLQEKNYSALKKHSVIIYFQYKETDFKKMLKRFKNESEIKLNEKLFNEWDKLLLKLSDIVVPCENTNKKENVKLFLKEVNQYYLKKGN